MTEVQEKSVGEPEQMGIEETFEALEGTIKKLEDGKTCYQVCERLSALYIVRDHLKGKRSAPVEVADRTSSQSQRDDM